MRLGLAVDGRNSGSESSFQLPNVVNAEARTARQLMKYIGMIGIFMISAVSMFVGLSRRAQSDANQASVTESQTTLHTPTWDEKNRRKANSIFFIEPPEWMTGESKAETKSDEPVSSGIQTNPFSE